MVTTKHICEKCGRTFPANELEQAVKHESTPIVEGDFDLVVLKDEDNYYLYGKRDQLTHEHERLYWAWEFYEAEVKLPNPRVCFRNNPVDYSVSELNEGIKKGEKKRLTPEELLNFKAVIVNSFYSTLADKLKTL